MNKRLGWLCALTATVAYSTNAPIVRGVILADMHPVTLLSARFLLAMLLYGVTLSVTSVGHASESRPLDSLGVWVSVGSGLLNGLTLSAFFTALETVSAAIASMTSILLVQLVTFGLLTLRGERMTPRNVVRLLIGLSGLYLLVGLGGSADLSGLLLVLMGAVCFAIHIVSVQWFLKPYNTWTITTLMVASATVMILILWLVSGADTHVPAPMGWVVILFQGVIVTFVARILTYSAVKAIGSGQLVLLSPLETSLTILWSVLFLQERLSNIQWIGTVFILLSTLLAADKVWQLVLRRSRQFTSRLCLFSSVWMAGAGK